MQDENADRRVQRTRKHLRSALVQLIMERGYDMLTIQDITDKANLGRSTFYLHYQSKDELLLDHHAEMREHFKLTTLTREELLSDEPQQQVITFLNLLTESRSMYFALRAAKDADVIMRGVREQMTANLRDSLLTIFPNIQPKIPLDVLTEYIIGAQLSLINWWMNERTAYDAPQLAKMLHQLQRAAICDAYRAEC
jgi:AcrR family transcriptional regulator